MFRCHIAIILGFTLMLTLTAHAIDRELVIIGGGHVGLITAALTQQQALDQGQKLNITILEKNNSIHKTTAANIWNSHTDDEIAAVVPRGAELERKLAVPFDQPGGILVSDVKGVNDSASAKRFMQQVSIDGNNAAAHQRRSELLLALGHAGMAKWKQFYEKNGLDLKSLLEQSNFNPCCEIGEDCATERFRGYRIDLIYGMQDGEQHAKQMVQTYSNLGYKQSRILSPDEVVARDPSLAHFCNEHSDGNEGARVWRTDSSAVWRPGGCLDTQRFLPLLVEHLKNSMGTYENELGETKHRFVIEYGKQVAAVIFGKDDTEKTVISGLRFVDGSVLRKDHKKVHYLFAPGESVGTLQQLQFHEPAYAGFAGASLSLELDMNPNLQKNYAQFNHYMEVHRPGTVLAWQGRVRDEKVFLGGAGTKAFYGDVAPQLHEEFATVKNLLQLQMFNDVLPGIVSDALGRDTKNEVMTLADLDMLVKNGVAKRWVGRRAVVFDGFPTVGRLYHDDEVVKNAQVTTHLGSGGGSFSLIMALMSTYAIEPQSVRDELLALGIDEKLAEEFLHFADSRRQAVLE